MSDIPDGGMILKWGAKTAAPRVREFKISRRKDNQYCISYKSHKIFAREERGHDLDYFYITPIRESTDEERKWVLGHPPAVVHFRDLQARKCFNIDFYEAEYPVAIGPQRVRSLTVFPVPDQVIYTLHEWLLGLMFTQGRYVVNNSNPEIPKLVDFELNRFPPPITLSKISSFATSSADYEDTPSKRNSLSGKLNSPQVNALLNSLPLPPPDDLSDIKLTEEGSEEEEEDYY
jgi:hypothetical protein